MMNRPSIDFDKRQAADLIFLLLLAGMTALYCYDAIRSSVHIYNLIMVLPLTVAILVLCVVQFFKTLRSKRADVEESRETTDVLPVILLFSLYVLSLNWLGFDVGTAIFVGAFLWMHGERRWPWLIGYSIVFAFLLTFFFANMLPYPMPILLPGLASTFSF
jgi:putative tricarboxylic transport membrane protein